MTGTLPLSPQDSLLLLQALQPIYQALVSEFVIDVPDCPLPQPSAQGENHAADLQPGAEDWFQQVDTQVQAHQLRQFLQSSSLASEPVLRNLLVRHLSKSVKSASDRDKIDFLLVQYFSLCTPEASDESSIDLTRVAEVLAPVLGPPSDMLPSWFGLVESLMQSAARCRRLSELLHNGILEQGRTLKIQAGEDFFGPGALPVFVRFNFMMRRIFFRLMHDDLNAIVDGLRELERRGIHTLDCRRALFSADESTARLRMICQSWKVMFHAEYSSGQPLRMLVDLRAAVDDALEAQASDPDASARSTSAGA